MQREWLASWLIRFRDARIAEGHIFMFDLSTEQFRVQFATMQRLIGLDAVTPHCLRHAGAAAMLEQDPTALQLVKRRGR